jgi:hypothetical protein
MKSPMSRSPTLLFKRLATPDSTTIALSLSMFDWAQYKRSKGAVKLHLVLDHDGYLFPVRGDQRRQAGRHPRSPEDEVGAGNHAGVRSRLCGLRLVVVIGTAKGCLVTRLKDKTDYEVMEKRVIAEKSKVLKDEVIVRFKLAAEDKECFLRRIRARKAGNHSVGHQPPQAGCQYDCGDLQRALANRGIFQALKQSLKLKTLGGTSENAVETQIWRH